MNFYSIQKINNNSKTFRCFHSLSKKASFNKQTDGGNKMKVVLLENVKKLGKKDEVIDVSDGYARNMLIPKKLALPATAENINNLKLKNKNEEKKEENLRNKAEEDKKVIEKNHFTMQIKTGESGRTFGSITSKEIADLIKESLNINVDRKDIMLDEPIKHIGSYEVKIRLHKDIIATINIKVTDEE